MAIAIETHVLQSKAEQVRSDKTLARDRIARPAQTWKKARALAIVGGIAVLLLGSLVWVRLHWLLRMFHLEQLTSKVSRNSH